MNYPHIALIVSNSLAKAEAAGAVMIFETSLEFGCYVFLSAVTRFQIEIVIGSPSGLSSRLCVGCNLVVLLQTTILLEANQKCQQ